MRRKTRKIGRISSFKRMPDTDSWPIGTVKEINHALRFCPVREIRQKALERLEDMAESLDENGSRDILNLSENKQALKTAIGKVNCITTLIERFRRNEYMILGWQHEMEQSGKDEEGVLEISGLQELNCAIIKRLASFINHDPEITTMMAIIMVVDYSDDASDRAAALRRLFAILSADEGNAWVPCDGGYKRFESCAPGAALDFISAKADSVISAIEMVKKEDAFSGLALTMGLDRIASMGAAKTEGLMKISRYLEANKPLPD